MKTAQEIIAGVEEANRPCVELANYTGTGLWTLLRSEPSYEVVEVIGQTVYVKWNNICFTVTVSLIDEADFWLDLHGVTPTLENGGAKNCE